MGPKNQGPSEPGQGIPLPRSQFLVRKHPLSRTTAKTQAVIRIGLDIQTVTNRYVVHREPGHLPKLQFTATVQIHGNLKIERRLGA